MTFVLENGCECVVVNGIGKISTLCECWNDGSFALEYVPNNLLGLPMVNINHNHIRELKEAYHDMWRESILNPLSEQFFDFAGVYSNLLVSVAEHYGVKDEEIDSVISDMFV